MSDLQAEEARRPRTQAEAMWWRIKSEPFVPIFMFATVGALVGAWVKHRQGKAQEFNYWLRARVGFQALAVVSLVGYAYSRQQTPAQQAELKAQEKAAEDAEFQRRLRDAEDMTRMENDAMAMAKAKAAGEGRKTWFGGILGR